MWKIQRFDRSEDAASLLKLAGLDKFALSKTEPARIELFDDGAFLTLPITVKVGPEIHDYLKGLQ